MFSFVLALALIFLLYIMKHTFEIFPYVWNKKIKLNLGKFWLMYNLTCIKFCGMQPLHKLESGCTACQLLQGGDIYIYILTNTTIMDNIKNPGFIIHTYTIWPADILMGLPTNILHYRHSHETHYFLVSIGQIPQCGWHLACM